MPETKRAKNQPVLMEAIDVIAENALSARAEPMAFSLAPWRWCKGACFTELMFVAVFLTTSSLCQAQPGTATLARHVDGDDGWAQAAAIYGVSAAATTLGLSTASELTRNRLIPSLPIGIAATVLLASSVPIVAAGGSSARRYGDTRGVPGLRIGGWISYALALGDAFALIGMGAAKVQPPRGVIESVGALGAVALICLVVDAFVSAAQARRTHYARVERHMRFTPLLSWSNTAGHVSLGAGLAARF